MMIIEYVLCARWPHLIVTVNYELGVTVSILQMRNHSAHAVQHSCLHHFSVPAHVFSHHSSHWWC